MPRYNIPIYGVVSANVDVEAGSYDEAVQKALEEPPQTDFVFAKFAPVDEWRAAEKDGYYRDGEYIGFDNPTNGQ